jgi:hypothetical protein
LNSTQVAKVVVDLGILRLQADSLFEMLQGLRLAPLFDENSAEMVVSIGKIRFQA